MYAWKRFRVGDPVGGYKESPTGVALGGAFQVGQGDSKDWCYYVGKYEVTEDQFYAVSPKPEEFKKTNLPVRDISWFDVEDFVRHYNTWLYANALDRIPEYGGIPGYLRLPTEYEWEFAARGGSKVSNAQFDRRTPYPAGKLADYEWFSGPKSSHNKVKPVGLLKPNPLGLYDMLGNVEEMTRSLYQVEYYQGRSGGYVAKGGHYLTNEKQIRSSLRTEQEFYAFNRKTKKPSPGKTKTLGFRLVISSLVFPNRQISNLMKEGWESYHKGMGQSLPAAVSTSAISTKTKVSGSDASVYLLQLKTQLNKSGAMSDAVRQYLDNLSSSLDEIQFTIHQAEKDSAYAWLRTAGEQAFFIVREARKLPILKKLQNAAKLSQRTLILKKYESREKEIRQNVTQAMLSYTESIRQLGLTGDMAFEDGIKRYRHFLTMRQAGPQLLLLATLEKHVRFYLKNKRTDDGQWEKDLTQQAQSGKVQ